MLQAFSPHRHHYLTSLRVHRESGGAGSIPNTSRSEDATWGYNNVLGKLRIPATLLSDFLNASEGQQFSLACPADTSLLSQTWPVVLIWIEAEVLMAHNTRKPLSRKKQREKWSKNLFAYNFSLCFDPLNIAAKFLPIQGSKDPSSRSSYDCLLFQLSRLIPNWQFFSWGINFEQHHWQLDAAFPHRRMSHAAQVPLPTSHPTLQQCVHVDSNIIQWIFNLMAFKRARRDLSD